MIYGLMFCEKYKLNSRNKKKGRITLRAQKSVLISFFILFFLLVVYGVKKIILLRAYLFTLPLRYG